MQAHVPAAFEAVRLAGAAYLVYLGIRMFLSRDAGLPREAAAPGAGLARIFRQGVVIEVLNPKTALFFLSFLPQFVDPGAGAIATQILILGAIVPVAMLPVDLLVALSGGALGDRLGMFGRHRHGQLHAISALDLDEGRVGAVRDRARFHKLGCRRRQDTPHDLVGFRAHVVCPMPGRIERAIVHRESTDGGGGSVEIPRRRLRICRRAARHRDGEGSCQSEAR